MLERATFYNPGVSTHTCCCPTPHGPQSHPWLCPGHCVKACPCRVCVPQGQRGCPQACRPANKQKTSPWELRARAGFWIALHSFSASSCFWVFISRKSLICSGFVTAVAPTKTEAALPTQLSVPRALCPNLGSSKILELVTTQRREALVGRELETSTLKNGAGYWDGNQRTKTQEEGLISSQGGGKTQVTGFPRVLLGCRGHDKEVYFPSTTLGTEPTTDVLSAFLSAMTWSDMEILSQ